MKKKPRPIHCSFCLGEGHHIHRCTDTSISLLNEEIEEIAAMDWKLTLDSGFIIQKLLSLSTAELKVLGYKHSIPNMNKIPNADLAVTLATKFLENTNTHRYILDNLNPTELDYFAEKVYLYTLYCNSDEVMSKDEISNLLRGDIPDAIKNDELVITTLNSHINEPLLFYIDFFQPFTDSLNLTYISHGIYAIHYSYYTFIGFGIIYLLYATISSLTMTNEPL